MEEVIKKAISGNKAAVEFVIMEVKDLVYNICLKMLLIPEDAQDASQEILIRIVTHLSTFKGKSKFSTWVYQVATNYLKDYKRKSSAFKPMSFDEYEKFIDTGHSASVSYAENEGELKLLEEEVKVSCTHGLLLCLDKAHRLSYILGEILELNSIEGGKILEISPENFRKQLSRARIKIRAFLSKKCGLVKPENPCRCRKKIDFLVENNSIKPRKIRFAQHSDRSIELLDKIDTVQKSLALYQGVPVFPTPDKVVTNLKQTIKILEYE